MLKSIKVALLALCLPLAAFAADFKESVHYETLSLEKSKAPRVVEFFSFYCPACYRFEGVAKALDASLPATVPLEKLHVNFLGGLPPEVQGYLSYGYIIAKQFGVESQVVDQVFSTIHEQNGRFANMKDVQKLLEAHGVSAEKFDSALASMPVISAEKAMQDEQKRFSEAGAVRGVPTFIVNDKYRVITSSLNSQAQFNELVKYLLEK
ncbi:disulfide bond formation protein [Pseudoalteromonas luteoviolacea]|uniref:Thiol:disulfide interchange protein n=1 Tax=Pseudoalteromonas luteoviolacea TaxID=43657 RepID=A0A0C1QIK8_9GAMM|nr:thiol:disulfide interchange protein DsbA/DsbL [Pseudoalteromonas luteoviolacea]KID59115.1 disulfide bond formation protein [Pseudoalteromonas luteoviolacea]